ncbi:MAG: hypothetical protein DRH50_10350 [Deltaproteobacteria bacterium]|nr:MAG: hypothetical protein DRH50_10350 [Deltaproteobacteria bacterium]
MDVISSQRITIGRPTSSPSQFAAVQDELLNQVAEAGSERVLILVGAGLSKAVGLPSWNKLLKKLGINGKPPPTEHELRRNRLGNELPEILKVEPKRLGLGPTHRLLAMSGVRGILTTNYDKVIEMAFTNAGLHDQDYYLTTPWAINWSKISISKSPFLLKLHGDMGNVEDLIISKEDYHAIKLYAARKPLLSKPKTPREKNAPRYVNCLTALMSTHILISIGFRWTDPAIKAIIRASKSIFGDNVIQHYAIFNRKTSSSNEKLLKCSRIGRSKLGAIGYVDEYKDIWVLLRNLARLSNPDFPNLSLKPHIEKGEVNPADDLARPFWLYPATPRPDTLEQKESEFCPRMLYVLHPVYNANREVIVWLKRHAKQRQEKLKEINQVVQCYGLEISDDLVPRYALVCEYLDGWERWADLERDNPDEVKDLSTRVDLAIEVTKAMNKCHKQGFKHGLFSGEAVWVGPPDSNGRRGVKLDGFEWYSLPDPIFRKAVAAAREEDLAPEVFEAMGEESESTSLYDGSLPESADIYSLAQFVKICLDEADREETDWQETDSGRNLLDWLQKAAEHKKESRPADLTELVNLLDKLGTAIR